MRGKNVKKWIAWLTALLLAAGCALPASAATGPAEVAAEAYLVMDADTGQVLLAKNADEQLSPASVTKIMTIGLACEKAQGDWSVQLTVSHDDVHSLYGTDSSHIALQEGEVVTLEDMLYAAEISSANDACNVLAEYIGGSIEGGVAAMNAKAAELGLENTHFANPHGISEEGHYTTARDLAVILRWALQQPGFETVFCRSEVYYMAPTNLQSQERGFWLQDRMRMSGSSYYQPEILGSKIGYTDEARQTYACLAEKDGVRVICTLLKNQSKVERYVDTDLLLQHTFENFHRVTLSGDSLAQVTVSGGGEALGRTTAHTASATVLLASGLDESAVSLTMTEDAAYTLGGAAPTATVTVTGGGVQEDSTYTVPLQLDGLDELLNSYLGKTLPAAGDVAARGAAWPAVVLAVLALAAAGAAALVLWKKQQRRARRRRKRLRAARKYGMI